ncbi:MAG: PAS domain-containing protein [Myxococcota bacterium]
MGGRPSQDPIPEPGTTSEPTPAEELPAGASASVEAQLRDRIRELEAIYRYTPVGLSVVDRDLRFVRINERMASFNGRSVEEHLGRRMEEVIPLAARRPAIALARGVLESGRPVLDFELNTEWRGAARLTWLVSCHPLREDGEVTGLLTVLQSVTYLKRAEEEARAAEVRAQRQYAEFELLYREAPVGLAMVDRELRFLRVNETMARLNGRDVDDHLGRSAPEMVPEAAEPICSLVDRVFATGEPLRDREVSARPPGDPLRDYTWLLNLHPVLDGSGGVRAVLVVLQDVTRLKRTQHELRAVTERLARAAHLAGVGSWEWDILEDRVWWSEELYQLMGKRRTDFIPSMNGVFDLVHPDDRGRVREQINATLERDEPYALEFRMVLDDGTVLPVHTAASLERTPGGRPARLLGTVQSMPRNGSARPGDESQVS